MHVHVHRLILVLLLLATPVLAQGPQSIYFPGAQTQGTSGATATFQNFHAGPGQVTITGGAANGTDQMSNLSVNGVANVKAFGAYGDVNVDFDQNCSLPANSNTLTCADGSFKSGDVGKVIFVPDFTSSTITGSANNGSGAIRLTVNSTAKLNTANPLVVIGIQQGTVEANGRWAFSVIDGTHLDLLGSTYTHTWNTVGSADTPWVGNTYAPTLDTTIISYISPTQVTIAASRTDAVTSQNALWGHDDTTAIQNAYNSPSFQTLYFPDGNYLDRGANWTCTNNVQNGCKAKIYGESPWGNAAIFFVNVTDPGAVAGATKVGLQHFGYIDEVSRLRFVGGFQGAPDTAPFVTFLSARSTYGGGGGFAFNIDHLFDEDTFENWGMGGMSVMLYGAEQSHFQGFIGSDGYSSNGILDISACNSFGVVAPYAPIVSVYQMAGSISGSTLTVTTPPPGGILNPWGSVPTNPSTQPLSIVIYPAGGFVSGLVNSGINFGTVITGQLTGTAGGAGTYSLNKSATFASGTLYAQFSTSMTFVAIDGKKSVLAGWNAGDQQGHGYGGMIVLDEACNQFSYYAMDFNKIYTNQGNSTFLADTYTGTNTQAQLRSIRVRGFYAEPQTTNDRATSIQAYTANSVMEGQFYGNWGFVSGNTQWNFGLGFVNSTADIDTTGNAAGTASTLYAQTCRGSFLNLGMQQRGVTGCTDWAYNNGYNYPFGANNGGEFQPQTLAIGHMGTNPSYGPPYAPTISGGTLSAGSTDTFGEVTNTTGTVTLTFAQPFNNNVACVLTDDGQFLLWITQSKSASSVQFQCQTPAGAACPNGQFVQYHCAAVGRP